MNKPKPKLNIYVAMFELSDADIESPDPLDIYIEKIEALSQLLGCSEEEAEQIILTRL